MRRRRSTLRHERRNNLRKLEEEAWQTYHMRDHERLRDLLADVELITVIIHEGRVEEILGYWKELSEKYSVRETYRPALEEFAKKAKDEKQYAYVLNNVARICRAVGDNNGAAELMATASSMLRGTPSFMTFETAVTHGNLGVLLTEQGDLKGAEEAYASQILILSHIAPKTPLLLRAQNNLTNSYIMTGRYAQAEESCRKALDIIEATRSLGRFEGSEATEPRAEWSTLLDSESSDAWANWSKILYEKSDIEGAIESQKKSTDLGSSSPQQPPADLARKLYDLGILYGQVNRPEEQSKALLRARNALDREVTRDYLRHAFVTARLIQTEMSRNEPVRAGDYLAELEAQTSQIRSLKNEPLIVTLDTLASGLDRSGHPNEATTVFRLTEDLLARLGLEDTRDGAMIYFGLAQHHTRQKNLAKALVAAKKAFEICVRTKDRDGLINTATMLSEIQKPIESADAVAQTLKRAIDAASGIEELKAQSGNLWRDLGLIEEGREDWKSVRDCHQKACECYEQAKPGEQLVEPRARALAYYAEAQEKLGNLEQAEDYYRRAAKLAMEELGPKNRFTLVSLQMQQTFLTRFGKHEEARGDRQTASVAANRYGG